MNSAGLSYIPFENPVCAPDGAVFDIENIVPYVKVCLIIPGNCVSFLYYAIPAGVKRSYASILRNFLQKKKRHPLTGKPLEFKVMPLGQCWCFGEHK